MCRRLLLCLLLISACNKSSGGGAGDDGSGGVDAFMGAPGGTTYTLQLEVDNVPPDTEDTQCVVLQLPNTEALKVHELHDTLTPGSHHMIVYRDGSDTVQQTTPMNCQPFTGALNTSGQTEPLAITQKMDDDIVLPDGVAYTFQPNQMIRMELHYINTSTDTLNIIAKVVFTTADPSTITDEAGLLFTGSPDISLPPGQQSSLHEFFTVPPDIDLSHANIFAITGHEHHYGTGVTVNLGLDGSNGTLTPVYNPSSFSWSDPYTQEQAPPFSIPAGGGLDFTCEWDNTSSKTIKFGESACEEMCFFWMYYYPAPSSEVCIHTDQGSAYGLADLCCPSDNPLCSFLTSYFDQQGDGGSDANTPTCSY